MKKPILLIMAAGMGSRFGGLKQIEPIDDQGHVIIDYSIFDAKRAGFEKIVCIIKPEIEADFEERIGRRIRPFVNLVYAYHELDAPFAVLNADDFYGADAFRKIYGYLAQERDPGDNAMVAYELGNTLSDYGSVARGVCEIGEDGKLKTLTERLKIVKQGDAAAFTEDDGATWEPLAFDTPVSMNLFGLQPMVLDEFEKRFPAWLDENLPKNPLKCEYLLPRILDDMMREGLITIEMLTTSARWHGVTNRPDLPILQAAIKKMQDDGVYPVELWK